MNYRISADRHLRLDKNENQHKLLAGIRGDKRGQHSKLEAENVSLAMVVMLEHFHPIRYRWFVVIHLFKKANKLSSKISKPISN